ncbi:MAG TPA: hypothetical protein PLV55_05940 [Anaerohalosphaeraceae bacterium]|nr:hypothetical protein [Anaerohalosphaeraceae bacterium]
MNRIDYLAEAGQAYLSAVRLAGAQLQYADALAKCGVKAKYKPDRLFPLLYYKRRTFRTLAGLLWFLFDEEVNKKEKGKNNEPGKNKRIK